jgi:hypothetical protein
MAENRRIVGESGVGHFWPSFIKSPARDLASEVKQGCDWMATEYAFSAGEDSTDLQL